MVNLEMSITIKFNRQVNADKDYISVGGFEMIMGGKNFEFDFKDSYCYITKDCYDECEFNLYNPDYDAFEGFKLAEYGDIQNITEIKECFVYTGEETDLEPVMIKNITFVLLDNYKQIEIKEKVLNDFNERLIRGA